MPLATLPPTPGQCPVIKRSLSVLGPVVGSWAQTFRIAPTFAPELVLWFTARKWPIRIRLCNNWYCPRHGIWTVSRLGSIISDGVIDFSLLHVVFVTWCSGFICLFFNHWTPQVSFPLYFCMHLNVFFTYLWGYFKLPNSVIFSLTLIAKSRLLDVLFCILVQVPIKAPLLQWFVV